MESQCQTIMKKLESFANKIILPVNVSKTKAMLFHSVIAPPFPKITFRNQPIEFVKHFKYLGVTLSTKLGWGSYLNERKKKIQSTYNGMRSMFKSIPKDKINLRRQIFHGYALPQFIWIRPLWFFITEKQQQELSKLFLKGIKNTL